MSIKVKFKTIRPAMVYSIELGRYVEAETFKRVEKQDSLKRKLDAEFAEKMDKYKSEELASIREALKGLGF